MAAPEPIIKVEVAYAKPAAQVLLTVEIPVGNTVRQAIELSGILQQFPEIDLTRQTVGIFSQPCQLEQPLQAGDRVEIYCALLRDPKEARRSRALKR